MSYGGVPNWPPIWTTARDDPNDKLEGEAGILSTVLMLKMFKGKLFLAIEYKGRRYVAALTFDDSTFCSRLYIFLQPKIGCSIREVGNLDVSQLHALA
jgi:hypothetical protein